MTDNEDAWILGKVISRTSQDLKLNVNGKFLSRRKIVGGSEELKYEGVESSNDDLNDKSDDDMINLPHLVCIKQ